MTWPPLHQRQGRHLHNEDIAYTANVLRDHYPRLWPKLKHIQGMCQCGKQINTVQDWAVHVAEVLHS
jgi:hypothetical protein